MPTSLDSIFFHWTLSSLLLSHRSGVRCQLPLSVVPRQLLSAPFSNQLSFVSPYHFRPRRDFKSKNPLSGFAPKQTKESSAWRATYIVLHNFEGLGMRGVNPTLRGVTFAGPLTASVSVFANDISLCILPPGYEGGCWVRTNSRCQGQFWQKRRCAARCLEG